MLEVIPNEPVGETTYFVIGNIELDSVNLNLNNYYHDRVQSRAGSSDKLEGYWISNLALGWQLSPHIQLTFDGHNVFDEQYTTWSPQAGLEAGLPGRGRMLLAGVKVSGF